MKQRKALLNVGFRNTDRMIWALIWALWCPPGVGSNYIESSLEELSDSVTGISSIVSSETLSVLNSWRMLG